MTEKRLDGKFNLKTWSLLFFTVSLIGWAFETLICYFQSGDITDRGFLTLPFCPIYGFPVCVIYFLLGTPTDGLFFHLLGGGKGNEKSDQGRRAVAVVLYYLSSALFATAVELIVGVSLNKVGLPLWSYGDTPLTFMKVISLPVSIAWGGMITVFAQVCIPPLMRLFTKLPEGKKQFLTSLLWTVTLADFLVNGVYFLLTGNHFIG